MTHDIDPGNIFTGTFVYNFIGSIFECKTIHKYYWRQLQGCTVELLACGYYKHCQHNRLFEEL